MARGARNGLRVSWGLFVRRNGPGQDGPAYRDYAREPQAADPHSGAQVHRRPVVLGDWAVRTPSDGSCVRRGQAPLAGCATGRGRGSLLGATSAARVTPVPLAGRPVGSRHPG